MRISSQLLLNFLLNAAWQIALITALASLGAWLLRSSSARYRHWLWVSAFILAFLVPLTTAIRAYFETASPAVIEPIRIREPFPVRSVDLAIPGPEPSPFTFSLNTNLVFLLLGVYGLFVLYRGFKLVQAWHATRIIKRNALELAADDGIAAIMNKCEKDLASGSRQIRVMR